jgi:serine phosphatase RsbU (regulator of sigma subunit)/Tfp pilus assembly protein PilF
MKRFPLFLLALFFSAFSLAQNDSLLGVIAGNAHDSSKIKAYIRLSKEMRGQDIDRALGYARKGKQLAAAPANKGTKYDANAALELGLCYSALGQFDSAQVMLESALAIHKARKDKSSEGACLNALANIYAQQGKFQEALGYYFNVLTLASETGDVRRQATTYSNMGLTYTHMDDAQNAIKCFNETIRLREQVKDTKGMISTYVNLSSLYETTGNLPEAEAQIEKAAALLPFGTPSDSAIIFTARGTFAEDRKEFAKSLKLFNAALEINERIGDTRAASQTLLEIGCVYLSMRDTATANKFISRGMVQVREMNQLPLLEDAYEAVADRYAEIGMPGEAYKLLKKLLVLQDTLHSRELSEMIAQKEALYKTEKSQHEIDVYKKNKEIGDLELQRSRWLILLLALSVIAVLLIVGFLVNRNRLKQVVNEQLERQNSEITLQKKSITDSINYAKRIQDSILPPDSLVKKILPDSFVLYLPKDVVSGDFYWVEQRDNIAVFAAVDCTGHGVPGALMSVVGFNLLNQAVNETGLTRPADILRHLDHGVNKLLRQSEEANSVKDGMDLALCTLDAKSRVLQYAGVFNPAYVITGGDLQKIPADKSPIGMNLDGVADEYTNHTLQLAAGDMVYLFSDGFADQFGGASGKKYMYNRFRETLLKIHTLSTADQHRALQQEFISWKGTHEQVDDILVIGVRIS